MKQQASFLLVFGALVSLALFSPLIGHAETEEGAEDAQQAEAQEIDPPEFYAGQMPANKKLAVYAECKVIATYSGQEYSLCQGERGACPDRCGASGDYAGFEITGYVIYKKLHKYGDDKWDSYRIQTSDFHRKPQGDPELLAYIHTLEKGDQVVIEWKHLYGEVSPGSHRPVRPLLLLKKIDSEGAKKLKEQAEAEHETKG